MSRGSLEDSNIFFSPNFFVFIVEGLRGLMFNCMKLFRFDDKDVQRDRKLVPYSIVDKGGKPYIQVKVKDGESKVFSPEEISAMVLTKMKETAEAFLGETVKNAVITVPGMELKQFLFVGYYKNVNKSPFG